MLQPVGPNFHFALLKHRDRLPGNGVAVFFLQMVMSSWISNWSYLHSLRPVSCSSPVFTFSRSSHIKHFVFPCLYTLSVSLFWKLRSYINCLIGQRILLWGVWFICAFICAERLRRHLLLHGLPCGVCVRQGQWPVILWQTRCVCASTNPYITVWPYLTKQTPAFGKNSESIHSAAVIGSY